MGGDVVNFRVLRNANRRIADEALWIDFADPDVTTTFKGIPSAELKPLTEQVAGWSAMPMITQLMILSAALVSVEQKNNLARQWLSSEHSTASPRDATLDPLLLALDEWLVQRNNRPAGSEFERKLLELIKAENPAAKTANEFVRRVDFIKTYYRFLGTLLAGLILIRDPVAWPYEDRQRTQRLFIVLSLVMRWCAEKKSVDERREIAEFLRFARIRFPPAFLASLRQTNTLARRPGFIDHYVVREEWERYELGELADVNSVMPGETRKRTHVHHNEIEEQTQESSERVEVDQRNLQSENRFEFSQAMHEAQSLQLGADANVESTTLTGPNTTVVQVGGHFEYSSESSKDTASKHTREVIERAANMVQQRVSKARSMRQLTRITETNEHGFTNTTSDAKPINGIYRWIDRINRVTLLRFPRRYMIEFVLPEPGAWLRWALTSRGRDPRLPSAPPAWPALITSADEINATDGNVSDYRVLAKHLNVADLPPYPGNRVVGATLKIDPEDSDTFLLNPDSNDANNELYKNLPNRYATEARIGVPDGWQAVRFQATVTARNRFASGSTGGRVVVSVGNTRVDIVFDQGGLGMTAGGALNGLTTGQVPLHVMNLYTFGCAANIVVECEPTQEAIRQWQQTVFDRLLQSWQRQKLNYDSAVEAMRVAGELDDRHLSPGRVRELIQVELRRQIITLLDPNMPLAQTMRIEANGEPTLDATALAQRAPKILFFEQAFEWSTLSYILYPQYWSGKGRWVESATNESANPEFDRFIQSGSVRVVVAARPGFAEQVQFFLEYGALWGGGGIPAPNETGYLSVAEEIMDLQRGPADGEQVDNWTVRVPTALTALDPTGALPLTRT